MRVFLASLLTAIVFGAVALFALAPAQRTSALAYTTEGARINPKWSLRSILPASNKARVGQVANTGPGLNPGAIGGEIDESGAAGDGCDQSSALGMIFIDFGDSAKDSGCST
jgi:hypothetical protein